MRLPFNGSYKVNQYYNDACCRASYAQFGMKGHNGIDFALPTGTPVIASHSGKVYTGSEPGGYGNYMFVTGSQYQSVYGHLQKFSVASGAMVSEGQLIGYSDNTGYSSGAHLHWGVRPINYNSSNGFLGYIDPMPLLGATTPTGGTVPTEDEVKYIYSVAEGNAPSATDLQYYMTHPWKKLADRGLLKQGDRYKAQVAKLEAQIAAQGTELKPGKYLVK